MRATSALASIAAIFLSCVSNAGNTGSSSAPSLKPRPSQSQYLWPGGVIPYIVDPDVPRPERIYKAMAQWAAATPIRMVPWTTQKNYVRFVRQNNGGLCFSSIGMLGGEQKIRTDDRCNTGTLTHELGHTIGL